MSRSLGAFAAKMAKRYGEEKIANDPPPVIIPTGSLTLDWALRVGGWQQGRLYELLGPKDSSKTTMAILGMVNHQRAQPDRGVAYVNLERTFAAAWARILGLSCSAEDIRTGRWAPLLASSTEEASDMARDYVGSGEYSVLVVDSIGSMESRRVLEKDAEKAADAMGRNAKIITQMSKALATMAKDSQCTVLLINQPRANMSGMGGDVSAGPKAMQHATTAKIQFSARGSTEDVRKVKFYSDMDPELVGQRMRARVTRMKNGAPGRQAEYFIMNQATEEFGPAGLDTGDEVAALGARLGVISQRPGGWYTLPDGAEIRGRGNLGVYLREHPDSLAAIRKSLDFETPQEETDAG